MHTGYKFQLRVSNRTSMSLPEFLKSFESIRVIRGRKTFFHNLVQPYRSYVTMQ